RLQGAITSGRISPRHARPCPGNPTPIQAESVLLDQHSAANQTSPEKSGCATDSALVVRSPRLAQTECPDAAVLRVPAPSPAAATRSHSPTPQLVRPAC